MASLILLSVNGGAYASGAQIVPSGATIALKPVFSSLLTIGRWEIFGFPPNNDRTAWAGPGTGDWTFDPVAQVWRSNELTPAPFTLPASTVCWGKWCVRFIANNGYDPATGKGIELDPAGNVLPSGVVDISGGWHVLSPLAGLYDVSPDEAVQFNPLTWVRELQYTLRTIDHGLGSTGGAVVMGGDVTGPSSNATVNKILNIPLDAATMTSPPDTSFIQKLSGAWKAITTTAAAVAILGASLTNAPPAAGYIPVSASSNTATWTAESSITAGGVSPGTAGQIYITNATPAAAWTSLVSVELTHGRFTSGGTGSDWLGVFGAFPGFETTNAGLWLLANGGTPGITNYAIQANSSTTLFNAPTNLQFVLGGMSGTASLYLTGTVAYMGGVSTAAPLVFNWSTATTPIIQSGMSATQLTVSTNKAGAVLNLNADANQTSVQIDWAGNRIISALNNLVLNVSGGAVIQSGTSATSLTVGTDKASAAMVFQYDAAAAALSIDKATSFSAGAANWSVPLVVKSGNDASGNAGVLITRGGLAAADGVMLMGPWDATHAAFWAGGSAASPTTSNYSFLGDNNSTWFNAPNALSTGQLNFYVGNSVNIGTWSVSTFIVGNIGAGGTNGWQSTFGATPVISTGSTVTSFTITSGNTTTTSSMHFGLAAMTADAAPGNVTIQGGYAWSGASTNLTAGNVVFDVGPPIGAGTVEGKFQFTRNGATIGQLAAADSVPSYGRFWLGSTAYTASNWVIQADANATTDFNAPSGGQIGFVLGGATFVMEAQSTNLWIGGSVSASPLVINWAVSTAPIIQSTSSATTGLTVGTDAAGAKLVLQGGAAVTVETLSGCGVSWSPASSQASAFNFSTSTGKVYWPVNTSGGGVTGTLPAASSVPAGTTWYVQDNQGAFQANAFTLAPTGTDKINGVNANEPFNTNWSTVLVWTDGAQWFARAI